MNTTVSQDFDAAFRSKKWRLASKILEQHIAADPANASLLRSRSEVHMKRKLFERALADANTAIRLDRHSPDGYKVKGDVYVCLAQYDMAVTAYREGLLLSPHDARLHLHLRHALSLAADAGDQLDRRSSEAIRAATAALSSQQYSRAIRHLTVAIDLEPSRVELLTRRADAYVRTGQLQSALADAAAAVRLEPSHHTYRHQGDVYRRMQRLGDASCSYSQGLSLRPTDPQLRHALAEVAQLTAANESGLLQHKKSLSRRRLRSLLYTPYDGCVEDFCCDGYPLLRAGSTREEEEEEGEEGEEGEGGKGNGGGESKGNDKGKGRGNGKGKSKGKGRGKVRGKLPCKIALAVTLYNETGDELERTLKGIASSHIAGVEWREMVVAVVCDGHAKVHDSMKAMAEQMGMFDPSLIDYTKLDTTTMHLFQSDRISFSAKEPAVCMQVMFMLKEKNGGKLNSHDWFFQACANSLRPTYAYLVDVGTVPRPPALGLLYAAMEADPQLGGVCGEIAVDELRMSSLVQCAQHYEYKISHIMEKSMETMFGFVSVLPGAFSAYRYCAIEGRPLDSYFRMERGDPKDIEAVKNSAFLSNMYLAEDRIMAFELLVKEGCDWTLGYVCGAVAFTDVPESIVALTKQRRRWMNGSFFAGLYCLLNFSRLFQSGHSALRQLALLFQFFYMWVNVLVMWIALGNAVVALLIAANIAFGEGSALERYLINGYFALIMLQILFALGNRPDTITVIYKGISFLFGAIMFAAAAVLAAAAMQGDITQLEVIAIISFVGGGVYSALLYGELWCLMKVFFHYLILCPTFINVFTIFAFCNIHDVSWGTRPGDAHGGSASAFATSAAGGGGSGASTHRDYAVLPSDEARAAHTALVAASRREAQAAARKAAERATSFKRFRSNLMASWLLTQIAYVSVMTEIWHTPFFAWWIMGLAAFIMSVRLIGCTLYQLRAAWRVIKLAACGRCADRGSDGGGSYKPVSQEQPEPQQQQQQQQQGKRRRRSSSRRQHRRQSTASTAGTTTAAALEGPQPQGAAANGDDDLALEVAPPSPATTDDAPTTAAAAAPDTAAAAAPSSRGGRGVDSSSNMEAVAPAATAALPRLACMLAAAAAAATDEEEEEAGTPLLRRTPPPPLLALGSTTTDDDGGPTAAVATCRSPSAIV